MKTICEECGGPIERGSRSPANKKFCCTECQQKAYRAKKSKGPYDKICGICKKPFQHHSEQVLYCSDPCRTKAAGNRCTYEHIQPIYQMRGCPWDLGELHSDIPGVHPNSTLYLPFPGVSVGAG